MSDVTIGAVEAVLSARDLMSDTMVKAAERVKSLEFQLKNLGVSATDSADKVQAAAIIINDSLKTAQANFDALAKLNAGAVAGAIQVAQERMTAAAAAANNLGTAAAAAAGGGGMGAIPPAAAAAGGAVEESGKKIVIAGQSMTQVENIAMRLVERMLILYAIRGSFEFVKGIFDSADALQKMSDNLEIGTGKLQEWQYAAEKTGVPFQQLLTAVDNLNKGMAEGKSSTVGALDTLGLSFDKLWSMDPGTRFDTVADAVSKVEDKLVRTGLEVELFGSDKIDGLIKHLSGLEEEAQKAGVILGPDTVRSLSQSEDAMKHAITLFKVYGAEALDYAQRVAGGMALISAAPFSADARAALKLGFQGANPDSTLPNLPNSPGADLPGQLSKAPFDPNDKAGQQALDAAAKASDAQTRIAIAAEQAADRYSKAWERAEKDISIMWDKDIEAMAAREKVKAGIEDTFIKNRVSEEEKTNKRRLDSGAITETQYYDMKFALERKYWDQHNDTLKANETFELNRLSDKENEELAKLEERYSNGLIDEDQYQEERLAITSKYATERLTVEDQFNANMDERRRAELEKETEDRRAALAQQASDKKAASDAAFHQRVMDAGNTSKLPELSQADLMMQYGSLENAKARLKDIQSYYSQFPGAQSGVAGATGLGSPGGLAGDTKEGWDMLLAMQREYAQLLVAVGKLSTETNNAIRHATIDTVSGISSATEAARKAITDTIGSTQTAASVVTAAMSGGIIVPSAHGPSNVVINHDTQIDVNGILDPTTIRTLSEMVGNEILKASKISGIQYTSR